MDREILSALSDWNIWWETKSVPRDLKGKERLRDNLLSTLRFKEIKVITGVRRSGKSTLLYQLVSRLLPTVKPEQILLINFEDEALAKYSMDEIYNAYLSVRPVRNIYLFLDEVNRIKGWERWVRKVYDTRETKQIFVTGSSSFLLRGEYSSLLTGRNIKLEVFPLSFREFLDFSGFKIKDPSLLSSRKKAEIRGILEGYIEFGGFPEAFFKEKVDKRKLLVNYYEDIIFRDVADRHNIPAKRVRELANFLITNIANPASHRNIRNYLGMGMETISNYLVWLEDSYLIFQLPFFSYSLKEQQVRRKKTYCIDNGLRNAVCLRFSEDIGRLVENIVFIELKRRGKEVYYWKDERQREVDFVIKEGLKPNLIMQVCWDIRDEETKKREVKALVSGLKELKLKEGLVITEDFEDEEKIDGKLIRYKPLWQWLIE
jgi:hypothetical protein